MKRVLVIDDDIQLQQLLRRWLGNAGYETMGATNGNIGLDIQRDTPADLVITDIFMPEKEGTEVLMRMRDEFPQTQVFAISGGGGINGVDFLELASYLGATHVFKKPFEKQELMSAVHKVVG